MNAVTFCSLLVAATCSWSAGAAELRDLKALAQQVVDGKLPFSTGSSVSVKSSWLGRKCDVHASSPWAAATATPPFDSVGQELPKGSVLCNVHDDDDDGGSGGDCGGYWDCATRRAGAWVARSWEKVTGSTPLIGGGWQQTGFLILGADFQTPDILEGGPAVLKAQSIYKFCRVAGKKEHFAVVCDQMTSGGRDGGGKGDGKDQHFEMVRAPKRLEAAALAAAGFAIDSADGTDGIAYGPDDKKKKPVALLVRAPSNGGRYCGPNQKLHHSAPLTCNTREEDVNVHNVLLVKASGNPYGPP